MANATTSLDAKTSMTAEPVVYLVVSSDNHSILELSEIAERHIRDRLRQLMGVADVSTLGERRLTLQVRIDSALLSAYNLEMSDVESVLSRQNIPASSIHKRHELIEYILPSLEKMPPLETLGKVMVSQVRGISVHLGDIATLELGAEDARVTVTYKGKPAVALGLIKKWWAAKSVVLLSLRSAMPTIRAPLPPGVTVEAAYRSSLQIDNLETISFFHQ